MPLEHSLAFYAGAARARACRPSCTSTSRARTASACAAISGRRRQWPDRLDRLDARARLPAGRRPAAPTAVRRRAAPWARGIEGQRKADLGNGTFLNPILAGDHPDPSILKDGDDYYMTFSSFDAYPGLVIWHSRDLVNWQPIGPALTKNVGAVWAPDLVKHDGRYYIYFPGIAPYRSNYVVWADDIRGPWSEPIDLKIGRIDPGHAVGPDGRRYLFLSAGYRVPLGRRRAVGDRAGEEGLRRVEVSRVDWSSRASRRRARRSCGTATTTTWCWHRAARRGRRPAT